MEKFWFTQKFSRFDLIGIVLVSSLGVFHSFWWVLLAFPLSVISCAIQVSLEKTEHWKVNSSNKNSGD